MKILNLYYGIGGNRRLWGDEHEITAIEYLPEIAKIYQDHFPNDKVIITDAHKYLEENFDKFDFIWSSPPCPSHSHIRKELAVEQRKQNKAIFPDMKLYEEILFLQGYFKGKWCVENVVSWYEPLIKPQKLANHYFWTNFLIRPIKTQCREHHASIDNLEKRKGFDLKSYRGVDKRKALRNCVEPETGKLILEYAINPIETQQSLISPPLSHKDKTMKCKNCGKEMQYTHYMSYMDKNPDSEDLTHTDGYAWFCADCVQTVKISESEPHRDLEIEKIISP